jgi:ABC-type transporter Mla subunit MlaD
MFWSSSMIPTKSFAETVEHEIGQGLRARVRSQGITGTSFVSLEYLNPSFNPPLKVKWTPNHYYIPSAEGQFSQMLASIEKTLQNLEKLDLAALGDLLGKDLVSARDLITKLENLDFQAVLTNANGLVTDIRESNQRLQTLLDDTRNKVKALDVAGLNDRGEKLLTGLAETGEKIGRTVEQVDVSSLKQTLDSARQATERLDDVLRDLKEYPSGFLFGRPPSPARSLDSKRR